MSVSAFTALCFIQYFYFDEFGFFVACNDHLGNTLTIIDNEIFLRQVDKYYAYLTAIIGVDGAWCVKNGDTFLQGQSTAWAYLCLETYGQGNMQSRWDEFSFQRFQRNGCVEVGSEVHSGTLFCGILR